MHGSSDEPRVLVLGLGWFPTTRGGLDRYVRELVEQLSESTAVVVGPAPDAPSRVQAVASHDAPLPWRLAAFTRAALRQRTTTDVLDAHFALYAALPLLLTRRRPVVVHFHGPWADETAATGRRGRLGHRARRAVERMTCRRADAIVALSHEFASVVVEQTGVARERVVVVPPGVDRTRFSPGDRADARARVGLAPDDWVAVCVRRLVPRAGVDLLLSAWAAFADDPHAVLVVAGDGPERAQLEAAAHATGARVQFAGAVGDDGLVALYRAADVSVVPSRALEGFGLVVLESLACGTPVVVTDVGGLPEVVAPLQADLVVAATPAALAARLLAARRGTRPLPSAAACRAFTEAAGWDAVADRHRALYRAVGAAGRRPRVRFVDHTARPSGGELAMVRTVEALIGAPGTDGADVAVTLFEPGPIEAQLRAAGARVDVLPMGARGRDLERTRVAPGAVPARALVDALVQVVRLARHLRRERPDVVHANSLKAALVAGVACRAVGVPMVWHVRDRLAPDYLPPFAVRMVRWAIPRLADAVATLPAVAETLRLPPSTAVVALADPYRPPPRPPRPPAAPDAPLRIGLVGRISPWKGQEVFVRAFARAFTDGDAVAVIAGAPLFGEVEYEHRLREVVEELGLGDRVQLAGFVDDVPALLEQLDVLVHASVVPEPHGQVVVEGMAAGLPVVASAAGGPALVVSDGVDGLLVPPSDPDALAAALRRLRDDPALRARLGAAARRRAEDFDPDRVVPELRVLYDRVLRRERRHP